MKKIKEADQSEGVWLSSPARLSRIVIAHHSDLLKKNDLRLKINDFWF